jgi:hypothetical protein
MTSIASSPEEYINQLPDDRKDAIEAVRRVVLEHLPKGYEEVVRWGMITYEVPLSVYADTYNGQPLMYAALGNQKNHMAIYLTNVYGDPQLKEQFIDEYTAAAGKKPDMGASCVRFRKLDDLPLTVIAKVIAATPPDALVEQAKEVRMKGKDNK